MDADPGDGAGGLGEQVDAADGGNGGQSLAPEAHGADGGQVLCRAQLAGGVALEGQGGVRGAHATAVVGDPQKGHAPVPDLHRNLGGPGVHGVFQQLFYDAGGPLHHLARGDEVGDMGGKLDDFRHRFTSKHRCW